MNIVKLVKQSKKGNHVAFSQLIKTYEKDMYRVAIAITKNNEDSLDCIQETILTAYEKISTLKEEKYFKTWLIRILINNCKSNIIKNKKYVAFDDNYDKELKTNHYDITEVISLNTIVESLEDELRLLVVLYYYEDMSIKDISESLNLPTGTIKTRLSKARNYLKEKLLID